MAVQDASVLHLRCFSKVEHRPVKPPIGSVIESQLGIGSDAIPASSANSKVVSKSAGSEDPSVDGSPAQPTALVLEANLEDASRTAVDGALYPRTPWC